MRKLALCSFLVVAIASTAAVALGSSEATTFSFKQSTHKAGAPTGISFNVEFGDPAVANNVPAGLKAFKITMPKGAKFDPAAAPQCKATNAELMAQGAAACPAATRVGKGQATATDGNAVVNVAGFIFNEKVSGKNAFLFLFLINGAYAAAFDAPVKGNTLSATGLTGAVPGGLIVTKFSGTIAKRSKGKGKKKHVLITTPSSCPKSKKWVNKGTFTFVDGSKDSTTSSSACKP